MTVSAQRRPRWEHYLNFKGPEFDSFWEDYLREGNRDVLFIIGLGFDPRMCTGIKTILNAGGSGKRECLLVEFDEGAHSPSKKYKDRVNENRLTLEALLNDKGRLQSVTIPMWSDDGRRIGARRASEIVDGNSILSSYTDVIVDISALPRSIYFPLLAKLLYEIDNLQDCDRKVNLHVTVAEDVGTDKMIQEEGIDETATYLHGFSSALEREATAGIPIVWIPVLGEGKEIQLVRIYDHVKPDEICPVLPSPSRNPRRGDDLLLEYQELLFDRLRVEPQNIIYSCEHNPFETYRQIYRTIQRYDSALQPLRGCKIVISAISSKLLSIGALLAAYEAKKADYMVGIAHIESHGYVIKEDKLPKGNEELFSLWLAGECYDE